MSTFARNPPAPNGAQPPNDAVALSRLEEQSLGSGTSGLRWVGMRLTVFLMSLPHPPEKWSGNCDHSERAQQKKERGLFKPRDSWDSNSEYQAEKAEAPGSDMDAGGKRPESQQRESGKCLGVDVGHSCNVGHEHQMHCHKYGRPVQSLRP